LIENVVKTYSIKELVTIFGDEPQNDNDLHVYLSKNKFDEIPLKYPYRGANYAFIIILKGELTIQLNLITYKIAQNEMLVVRQQTVIQILKKTDNLKISSNSFTTDFILKNDFKKNEFDVLDFFTAKNIPKLKLKKTDINNTKILLKLIKKQNLKNIKNKVFRNEIIKHSFSLLLYLFGALFKNEYPNLEADLTRKEELTMRFLKVLNENFKNEKSVKFYASTLCLTPDYLSKILKETTGKTASQLIDDTVIIEAKILLNNATGSVAEIAEELKFSNQSFFGKYFKKHVGFSPSDFRKQITK